MRQQVCHNGIRKTGAEKKKALRVPDQLVEEPRRKHEHAVPSTHRPLYHQVASKVRLLDTTSATPVKNVDAVQIVGEHVDGTPCLRLTTRHSNSCDTSKAPAFDTSQRLAGSTCDSPR
jgi:hypothetical protein